MSEFDKVANNILKRLNENFINSAADAIQHRWALTIAHPGLGEEDEEFRVIDHNLTADGVIEEYYVEYKDELVSVPAAEARVIQETGHDEEEPVEDESDDDEKGIDSKADLNKDGNLSEYEKKRGKAIQKSMAKGKKKKHDEDEEEINSIREAYGLPKKRKGPHGAKPKLNCRSVYSL